MSILRRHYAEGQIYFVTSVTYERRPILVVNRDLLWQAIDRIRGQLPFGLFAWAILPDHFHAVIDPRGADLSSLLQRIKLSFSSKYRERTGLRRGRTWQLRFWDHIIRDEIDLKIRFDYIHFNAVKRGLVQNPMDYPFSSLAEFVQQGGYSPDWSMLDGFSLEGAEGE